MKTIFIEILLVALFAASSTAQTDSVIKTKDVTISYFRIYKYKTQDSDSIFQRGGFAVLTDIKSIKFLNKDSLILKNDENYSVGLKTNNIRKIGYTRNNPDKIWVGSILGGVAGGTLGLLIGYLSTLDFSFDFFTDPKYYYPKEKDDHTVNYLVGGLLGTAVGCTVGALIGISANNETLDLFSVPEKDKKAKLIRFLHRNK